MFMRHSWGLFVDRGLIAHVCSQQQQQQGEKEEKEEQEKEEGGRPDKDKQLNTNEQESKNERIPSVWVGYLQATPNIATHSDAPKAEPIAPLAKMMG